MASKARSSRRNPKPPASGRAPGPQSISARDVAAEVTVTGDQSSSTPNPSGKSSATAASNPKAKRPSDRASGSTASAPKTPARVDRPEAEKSPDDVAHSAGEDATPAGRMTPLRELHLLEQHRQGGAKAHEALTELLSAYQRRIYSICFRMVRDVELASDLTQDAMVKVLEGLPSYDGRAKLSTWIIRVTMNCCLSHLRKAKVRETESLDAPAIATAGIGGKGRSGTGWAPVASRAGKEPLPGQGVEQNQLREAILQALDSLDVEARSMLVLRDLQDLDYQQLADVLDVPIGTVKSRLFRARAALRDALERISPGAAPTVQD